MLPYSKSNSQCYQMKNMGKSLDDIRARPFSVANIQYSMLFNGISGVIVSL